MTILHFSGRDYIAAGAVIVLFAGILLLNHFFPFYSI